MNSGAQVYLPKSRGLSSSSLQERSEHSFFLFYYYRMEDEAVLDRGASFLKHVCDEEEVEGKILNVICTLVAFILLWLAVIYRVTFIRPLAHGRNHYTHDLAVRG